jgi:LacI family transcriptional regulator
VGRADEHTATIATVARLAKVSVASASRALNGVRTQPATLGRVLAAAEQVGYLPNASARSLKSRRTGQIAFAMPDVANPVYTAMVRAIQQVAQAEGSRLVLHSTGANADEELGILRDLGRRFVDGLILVPITVTEAHVDALRRTAAPVVVIGRLPTSVAVDTVQADSRRGAALAIRHLHGLGRRRIALINGPQDTVPGRARRLGYLDGLRACGVDRDESLSEVAEDFTADAGRAAARVLFERSSADAVLCANDLLAAGAMDALHTLGRDVPREVAVVGMDDTDLARLTWPSLTSVDLASAERARVAAELLFKRIEDPDRAHSTVRVEARLVPRGSSTPADRDGGPQ